MGWSASSAKSQKTQAADATSPHYQANCCEARNSEEQENGACLLASK